MIKHISARSVNEALNQGLYHLSGFGLQEPSRNGPVIVSSMPVMTTYEAPRNRVLVNMKRDANPFFHLFESLWMLAGRNDLAFPQKFVSTFGQFSDDGATLWGAYGYRWRNHFGYDQLKVIIEELKRNPSTRRAVLQMWDGGAAWDTGDSDVTGRANTDMMQGDLNIAVSGGKDVPCNTAAYFDTIGGKLNMTVTCRSNDAVLGAAGANVVHFSFLLEYMAFMTGLPMGVYRQFSNNYHLYTELYPGLPLPDKAAITALADSVNASCIYSAPGALRARDFSKTHVNSPHLMHVGEEQGWHEDLDAFMDNFDVSDFETRFFKGVVGPMYETWEAWKAKDFENADHLTLSIRADDWRTAAQDWLNVRKERRGNGEAK